MSEIDKLKSGIPCSRHGVVIIVSTLFICSPVFSSHYNGTEVRLNRVQKLVDLKHAANSSLDCLGVANVTQACMEKSQAVLRSLGHAISNLTTLTNRQGQPYQSPDLMNSTSLNENFTALQVDRIDIRVDPAEIVEIKHEHEHVHESAGAADHDNLIQTAPEYLPKVLTLAALYLLFTAILVKHNAGKTKTLTCHLAPARYEFYSRFAPVGVNPYAGSKLQADFLELFEYDDDDSSEEHFPWAHQDMSHVSHMCPPDALFYGTNKRYRLAVETVAAILLKQPGPYDVYHVARALRHNPAIHPRVWYEALHRAVLERKDLAGIALPGPLDVFPDSFIPRDYWDEPWARSDTHNSSFLARTHHSECVHVDGHLGWDNGKENRLWYWREDLMLNSNHWYWHQQNPLSAKHHPDRRGELFYYFHHGLVARYNIERMCNGLDRVPSLATHEGAELWPPYNPHLDDWNSGESWTPRPSGTLLSGINHSRNKRMPQVIQLQTWNEYGHRVGTSLAHGYLLARNGHKKSIVNYDGIDIAGNTVEATDISFNPEHYGRDGYHNEGHVVIGLSADPDFEEKLPPGVMADPLTAVRDPIFFLWHTNTDNLFENHKETLRPYTPVGGDFPLLWPGILVSKFLVIGNHGGKNELRTFWKHREFELVGGGVGDNQYARRARHHHDNKLEVCAKHLDHEEFIYKIVIDRTDCAKTHSGAATIRIFLAPRFDEKGFRFKLNEQRRLFVPLDAFSVTLRPGKNVIKRKSIDSTLTIPWRKTLWDLQSESHSHPDPNPYCGCGWPHHLLLPKGTTSGKLFDLFVMVTNGDEDFVKEDFGKHHKPETCKAASIYCGIHHRKYPDAKPMGYPFDRRPFSVPLSSGVFDQIANKFGHGFRQVISIEEYVHGIPNMATEQIRIRQKE